MFLGPWNTSTTTVWLHTVSYGYIDWYFCKWWHMVEVICCDWHNGVRSLINKTTQWLKTININCSYDLVLEKVGRSTAAVQQECSSCHALKTSFVKFIMLLLVKTFWFIIIGPKADLQSVQTAAPSLRWQYSVHHTVCNKDIWYNFITYTQVVFVLDMLC